MTVPFGRGSVRFWALLLLVLAASPFTAPFASCDLAVLLLDDHHFGSALKSKSVDDKAVADAGAGPALPLPPATPPAHDKRVPDHEHRAGFRHERLRI